MDNVSKILKEKKFWFASALVFWAAALQGHMMWLQKQEAFKQKFGDLSDKNVEKEEAEGDMGKQKKSELLLD